MIPWQCRCGTSGVSVTDDQAYADWLRHAKVSGCSSIDQQQLIDARDDAEYISLEQAFEEFMAERVG